MPITFQGESELVKKGSITADQLIELKDLYERLINEFRANRPQASGYSQREDDIRFFIVKFKDVNSNEHLIIRDPIEKSNPTIKMIRNYMDYGIHALRNNITITSNVKFDEINYNRVKYFGVFIKDFSSSYPIPLQSTPRPIPLQVDVYHEELSGESFYIEDESSMEAFYEENTTLVEILDFLASEEFNDPAEEERLRLRTRQGVIDAMYRSYYIRHGLG